MLYHNFVKKEMNKNVMFSYAISGLSDESPNRFVIAGTHIARKYYEPKKGSCGRYHLVPLSGKGRGVGLGIEASPVVTPRMLVRNLQRNFTLT